MLNLINKLFYNKYDFFYLPIDLKTKLNVGFAFVNMTNAMFILDLYMELHY